MYNDLALRVAIIVDLLLLFPLLAYHRIRAHMNEKLDWRQEGLFILATWRPRRYRTGRS